MDQGFSLTEVLVSLVLVTGTSLALLKQQWQVSQLFNQIHLRAQALYQLDNASERLYAGHGFQPLDKPYTLHFNPLSAINHQQLVNLKLTWTSTQGLRALVRALVIESCDE